MEKLITLLLSGSILLSVSVPTVLATDYDTLVSPDTTVAEVELAAEVSKDEIGEDETPAMLMAFGIPEMSLVSEDENVKYIDEIYKKETFDVLPEAMDESARNVAKREKVSGVNRYALGVTEGESVGFLRGPNYLSVWDGTTVDTDWYIPTEENLTIANAAQLAGLAKLVNEGNDFSGKTVKLEADMDFKDKEWTPIGYSETYSFKGTFNGNGHIIKNIKITQLNGGGMGFFGYVSSGKINNIGIENISVKITNVTTKRVDNIGGIVGSTKGAVIDKCYVKDFAVSNKAQWCSEGYVGPLVGLLASSTLTNSYVLNATMYSYSTSYHSDLVGRIGADGGLTSTVRNCYSAGEFTLESGTRANFYHGGVVWARQTGISNVYYTNDAVGNVPNSKTYPEEEWKTMVSKKTDAELKAGASTLFTSDAFVEDINNQNEGYPCFEKYSISEKAILSLDIYSQSGDEYTLSVDNTLGAPLFTMNGTGDSLSVGETKLDITSEEWNNLRIEIDFVSGEAQISNGTQNANVMFTPNGGYGKITLTNISGGIKLTNVSIGLNRTKALTSLYDALSDAVSGVDFADFTGQALPDEIDGYAVEWSSSDTKIVSDDGTTVNQLAISQQAVLTAKINYTKFEFAQNAGLEANFNVTVPAIENVTDSEIVEAIINSYLTDSLLTDEPLNYVTKSLNLPTEHDGCTITWRSDNEDVVHPNGTVTLPDGTEDVEFIITATVVKGEDTEDKEFKINVPCVDNVIQTAMNDIEYDDLTEEDPTLLKDDIILPTEGLYGVSISWQSSDEDAISPEGFVTRNDSNATITLTATFEKNGKTNTKDFYFNVFLSDEAMLQEDLDADSFAMEEVTEDFSLPTEGSKWGSLYIWSSNNGAIAINALTGEATVTRPANNEQDAEVTLTCTAVQGNVTDIRTWDVTVPRSYTDEELVAICKEWLTFERISPHCESDTVRENFALPTVYKEGVTIEWVSNNDAVQNDGIIIRPNVGEPDATGVTLTATIIKGEATDTVIFTDITVKAFDEPEEVLAKAKAELLFANISEEPINMVSKDLNLFTDWRYGTTIAWTSSDEDIINPTTGVVTIPAFGSGKGDVTLTATLSYRGMTREREFNIKVVSESETISVFYEDFEGLNIGPYEDAKITDSSPKINLDVATDPIVPENNVGRIYREEQLDGHYVIKFVPSETRGNFELSMDVYIDSIPETGFFVRNDATYNAFTLQIKPDLSVVVQYKDWSSSTKTNGVKLGEWNNIRIKYNTLTETVQYWVNGIDISGKQSFIATKADIGARIISGIEFSYRNGDLTKPHSVYVDNIKLVRTVDYNEFLTAAYEEFELKFLSSQNINSISENLNIPEVVHFETDVNITSSNTAVVANDGTVTIPSVDTPVTLTVEFSNRWGGKLTRVFHLLVKADGTSVPGGNIDDAAAVITDMNSVISTIEQNNLLSNVKSNLILPSAGANGTTVTYESSDTTALSNKGVVTRGASDKNVVLYVIVRRGDTIERRPLNVTVKQQTQTTVFPAGNTNTTRPGSSSPGGIASGVPGNEKPVITPPPTSSESYSDVPKTHWANGAVEELSSLGIINGFDDGIFLPAANVKREEFAKMIAMVGGYDVDDVSETFTDVPSDAWYAPYINAVYKNNVVSGMGDGVFGVGMNITRQDMCVMMYNVLKSVATLPEATENKFIDGGEIADYAVEAINVLSAAGVINGDDDGNCNPASHATRAEAAQMLFNALKLLG